MSGSNSAGATKGFYTRVPTTSELTTALALRALFRPGNPSVLHVVGLAEHPRQAYPNASMVALTLSEGGLRRGSPPCSTRRLRAAAATATIEELGPRPLRPEPVLPRGRDLQPAAGLQPLDRRPARRRRRADRAGAGHHAARLAMGFDMARRRRAAAAAGPVKTTRRIRHGQSQAHARLLELRPHPPADRRPREARGHRSRHPDPAAAADASSACWTTRNSSSPSCRSRPTRR